MQNFSLIYYMYAKLPVTVRQTYAACKPSKYVCMSGPINFVIYAEMLSDNFIFQY